MIDGHLRIKAARKIGMVELPVILCDGWTDAQVKAFRLMANKSVSWAEWDDELLKLEFEELRELDFDLGMTGFDAKEIDHALKFGDAFDGKEDFDLPDQWMIIIECENEIRQKRLLDRFAEEGIKCRALIS